MIWRNIKANSNLIQHETEKAVLIKLPKSKMKFWHPKKLVRFEGKNDYLMSIGITDDFEVRLFRNGEGQYNRTDVLEEEEISGAELIERF